MGTFSHLFCLTYNSFYLNMKLQRLIQLSLVFLVVFFATDLEAKRGKNRRGKGKGKGKGKANGLIRKLIKDDVMQCKVDECWPQCFTQGCIECKTACITSNKSDNKQLKSCQKQCKKSGVCPKWKHVPKACKKCSK